MFCNSLVKEIYQFGEGDRQSYSQEFSRFIHADKISWGFAAISNPLKIGLIDTMLEQSYSPDLTCRYSVTTHDDQRLQSRGALPEVDRSHPSGSFFCISTQTSGESAKM
jgi:hypothetical protein